MARGARRRQEIRRPNLCRRRERPQARRAGPGTAEGEDGPLKLRQSVAEICNVLIVDLTRRDGDMAVAQPERGGGSLALGGMGVVGRPSVPGPVGYGGGGLVRRRRGGRQPTRV